MNTLKSFLLLGLLTGILLAAGAALGGRAGMMLALVVAAVMNLGTWFFADAIVIRTTGAQPLPEHELPWLHADVEEMARRAGIPKPRVYVLPHESSPNAFATGRSPDKGVVAVTAGLLHTLDRREVRGVLAHELGHIANRDTLVSAIAATVASALTFLAFYGRLGGGRRDANPLVLIAIMIGAPLAGLVIRMAISRTREYMADRRAAELTGDPEGLALALEGLSRGARAVPYHNDRAQSVHFIVNGFAGGMASLLSTHPPIEERVQRLRAMR